MWKCVYDGACSSISASVHNCVHVQNILKYGSTPASPRDSRGWKSIYNPNTQHQKVHSQGPRSNVEDTWGWVQSMNENQVAGWWEGTAADKTMLTYSWLMPFVVFSKGHKADSDGLETGPNAWSELEGGGRKGQKQETGFISIIPGPFKTRNKLQLKLQPFN